MKLQSFSRLSIIAVVFLLVAASRVKAASDVDVSTAATSGGAFAGTNPNVFTPTAAAAVANTTTIQTSLNGGNAVTINTASAAGGNGDLTISNGISKTAGASGTLTLNAVRDLAINGQLFSNTGTMPIVLTAGRNITNTQTLTTSGGNVTLSPAQAFTVGAAIDAGAGQVSIQTGSVESTAAYTITGSSVQVASAAAFRLQGTVAGPLTVGGIVSPAAISGTGSLQVNGAFTLQGTATNVADLGGTSEGSNFDRINATGAVTVAGALQVNLVNNFHDTIHNSHVFTIVRGSAIAGTFTGYPNGSRYTLANDYGSFRVNYTATTITLDDWKPVIVDLTWDPGTAEAGTQLFSNTNTRAGRHYFRILTQGTDIGAWRSRLILASGDAALYMSKTTLPIVGGSQFSSAQPGSDGFVLRDDQFNAGEEWYILVNATAGAQWSLFTGRAYVHDLGLLPFTDANSNSQYDIGEAVSAQTAPATPMPPEGMRFYKSTVPTGTPAWSLWLNGSTRDIALRTTKVPFHLSTSYYTRKQSGQMLVVPTVLGTGSNAYFMSVEAPQGESIGLDSRIQFVTDIAFQSTTSNVAVTGAPYRVYRTQVPIDQLAWDVSTTALAGNPNVCLRKSNVPAEWDNEAFSEATGSTLDSVTLVPDYLTNGTWFITVYGTGNYTFTLKSGDPVITPMNFTDLKVNDQTTRAGWRYYALTDIPSQVGSLGWELLLSNQVPGTQIALRRNKVPSRWLYRANGNMSTPSDIGTTYMDYFGNGGFLQRPGHQADVWYVGIYTPLQPLGAFTLDAHPIVPATVAFDGSNTPVAGLEPGRWRFQRIDVPAGVLGWDLRVKNATSGTPNLIVRRDVLPDTTGGNWGSPDSNPTWPSGNSWAGGLDWTGRTYEVYTPPYPTVGDRLLMGMGRPLEPGTYYVGVYNSNAGIAAGYTVESRGIGTGQTITVANLNYSAGSNATITNLTPREAAYFKVTIAPNTPSWEFTLAPSAGEMMMAMRRGTVPDFAAPGATAGVGVQYDASTGGNREIEMQKTGPERYLVLPRNDENFLLAGDYYIAVISEGASPSNTSTIGTGASSGVLTSLGAIVTPNLGAASLGGINQAVSLVGGQVKSYQFTVPAGTAGLELRLDNRVGNPVMSLVSGSRIPQPGITSPGYSYYGYDLGQYAAPVGGVSRIYEDNLITVANPPAGTYSLTVRAEAVGSEYPDASADLVIRQVVNPPVPLAFDGGTAPVSGHLIATWRYFEVIVPAGVTGWDLRLKNITGGTPSMIVRRDTPPTSTSGNWGSPDSNPTWPSGNSWAGGLDWTGRTYEVYVPPYPVVGDRLVMAMGRPLEPGTYYVGVYNSHASIAAAYTLESRGIGTGQTIPVTNFSPAAGSNTTITNLTPREAAYYKVTIPPNMPSWEFTLAPSAGEMMMAMRRDTVPDFAAPGATAGVGVQYDASTGGNREIEMQKTGPERYLVLPRNDEDFILAGDYYIAVISEGVNPPNTSTIGTGTSSGVLTSLGTFSTTDLGAASGGGINQPVSLVGGQVKSYQFTVPVGTASLEVRLDNRVANPIMSLISGGRIPQPGITSPGYSYYGYDLGQYSAKPGAVARLYEDNLITLANPPSGTYSVTVRAEAVGSEYPDASANLVIVANPPVPLAFNNGTATVSGQSPTAWRYFTVTVPAGVLGWDLRLKNITGGTPSMIVRRDILPDSASGNWGSPENNTTWPSGNSWAGTLDWTGRTYEVYVPPYPTVGDRLVMAMGRPLEPGTYYVGIYNSHGSIAAGYTVESRGIGTGQAITVADFNPAAGNNTAITNLTPREAAYFKVTIPPNTPSWEFSLEPSAGEMMMAMRRGAVPDFNAPGSSGGAGVQYVSGSCEIEMQKPGPERYLVLPRNDADYIVPGDYYIAVISEGVNPPNTSTIGAGPSSGVLTSLGAYGTTALGAASVGGITQPVSLLGAQVKSYQFTVPVGTLTLELRLDNRVGNPVMSVISGSRVCQPGLTPGNYSYYGYDGGQYAVPPGGLDRLYEDNLITVTNPPAGTYSVTVRAEAVGSDYPDATCNLVIRQVPRIPLNFAASLNGNGLSHTVTRQLLDTQKDFLEVAVPTTLSGQPVIGWLVKMNNLQGNTTMRIYKTWGNPGTGITVSGNTALIVPPFLTPGDTWFIEVTGTGLTNYTITSQQVILERPVWTMPLGHNTTFGDSGNDSAGNPLPGDRGVDIGQDDWQFYAIDVPDGNAGLLRTELQAINGNPNLYIREDGVPTTDHYSAGPGGSSLIHRSLTSTASEYGNWVPFDGRYEKQLHTGRWYLGVKASGASNARYRLRVSTGQVTDLSLNGGNAAGQILVGRDWRYYRFTVPEDAPNTWSVTFSQQVGDVNLWLRDTLPPGNRTDGLETSSPNASSGLRTWSSDDKNQGPYSTAGQDAAGTYPFSTPPLRPGHTYYAGFRAANDATFTLSCATSGGSVGILPDLDYYTGSLNINVSAGTSVLYRIPVPANGTRMKWTAIHPASVQLRVEQGTIPGITGTQHWTSGASANVTFNQILTTTTWPWQPDHNYYLRVMNTSGSPQSVALTMLGKNAATDDEDADGLPDAWELTYFPSAGSYTGISDPDGDGVTNAVEFTDGTNPNNVNSAKYFLTVTPVGGTASKGPDLPKYDRGSTVNLTDTPLSNYAFLGWQRTGSYGDDFAVKVTGTVTIPATGTYTFATSAADGLLLKVNNLTVISDDTTHAVTDKFGQLVLAAGTYPLELTAFEYNTGEALELFAAAGSHASFNSSFKLLGDTANGGLVVQTISGASTVSGLTVQQIIGVGTGNIFNLARMNELLTGIRPKRAETTRIAQTLNYLGSASVEGHFTSNSVFPLLRHDTDNPFALEIFGDYTITAVNTVPLPLAVDSPALAFTTTSDVPWLGQISTTHDSVDAGQSGLIGNLQDTWVDTTVSGPGNLSFWWKVSSEVGYDYFEFYIDGVLQSGRISGNVDWVQKSYPLAGGTHTFRWRYTKDGSAAAGSDAGWVDQVVWTGGLSAYAIWQAANFSPAQVADPLVSGPNADPDKDGLKNILEFAFNLNPNSGAPIQLPQGQRTGGNFVISFTEPAGINGITYGGQWSTTLDAGSWLPVPDTGSGGVHTFSVPIGSHTTMFMRLTVTTP